jgi:hypothetical protein
MTLRRRRQLAAGIGCRPRLLLQGGRDVPHLVPEEHEQVVERKDPHYLALPIDDRAAAASPPHLSRRRPTSTYRELLDGLCREHHV